MPNQTKLTNVYKSSAELNGTYVKIKQGELFGALTSNDGFEYVSFWGIPYAKPPIGRLRFKNPEPADGWEGIRNATHPWDIYIQFYKPIFPEPQGSEDGLFLNIHIPVDRDVQQKLPVMVFLHGGGFQSGSGCESVFLPDNLIQKGVILVTLNYRLGLLGFLSLNLPGAPGNAGLKDQTMALKWIRDNIGDFGGDRDNVTLFGESAGSASVCLHMLSPMSEGLFHRAIMQSGTFFNPWAMVHDPEAAAFEFARTLNIQYQNKHELLEALLATPASDLAKLIGFSPMNKYFFGPVVEKSFEGVEAFLDEPPMDIVSKESYKAVPAIVGFNSKEGILLLPYKSNTREIPMTTQEVDEAFKNSVAELNLPEEQQSQALDMLKKQYNLSDSSSGSNHIENYVDLMSDVYFIVGANKFATIMGKKHQSIYFYKFSYHGNYNVYSHTIKYKYKGAAHADDLGYVFHPRKKPFLQEGDPERDPIMNRTKDDIRVSETFAELWTNFAKYGNPTPEITDLISTLWEPVTPNTTYCLEIDKEIRMITDPFKRRMRFWDEFIERFELKNGCRFTVPKFDRNQ